MKILEHLKYRVLNTPNDICLVSPEQSFTFEQLDQYSDAIAMHIVDFGEKDIIPLFIKDDIFILPVVLGIMKIGKIPLPLTNSLIFEQSILRIEDVDYDLIVTDERGINDNINNFNSKILTIPRPFFNYKKVDYSKFKESDIAYIICTSGSTGTPKKVFLSQNNITWLLEEFYPLVNFNKLSRFLFTTPYTFDVSLTEIFSPIYTGGKLYCFSEKLKNVGKVKFTLEYVYEYSITHLSVSPTYAELLVDTAPVDAFKGLKYICLAGEKFGMRLAYKLSKIMKNGTQILNLYGPSETTIYATYYKLSGKESTNIPIGKVINGCEIKVLDENYEEQKQGELYIGGNGVTLGYLLNEKLTKESFVKLGSKIFYKTGDFVSFNEKMELIFETRKDNQIQINGIRVELEEIENIILKFKEIKSCKTVYEDRKIFIFYQTLFHESTLPERLKKSLPSYLNAILIDVPEFIINQNRKFDARRMIDKYYFNDYFSKRKTVNFELELILKDLGIHSYDDMDSLDTVRFFSDVEKKFDLKIDQSLISSLTELEQVKILIEKKAETSYKRNLIEEDSITNKINELNIELMLNNYLSEDDLEEKLIPTLFMQKQYFMKKYNSILSVDFDYADFSFEGIKHIEAILLQMANEIDVLRMTIIENDGHLYFKKTKKNKIIPVIYVLKNRLPNNSIKYFLYNGKINQQFLTTACLDEKRLTVYFSHNIMDKGSLFKFSKLFNLLLNRKKIHWHSESYEKYIEFIKEKNKNIGIDEVIKLIPETLYDLPKLRESIEGRIILLKANLYNKEAIPITIEAIYKYAQYIYKLEKKTKILTGSFIANIKKYDDFTTEKLMGDIHTTIPFQIKLGQSFYDFNNSVICQLDRHRSGLHIRDKIFDGYPNFTGKHGIAKAKLEKLNVSFNYLGEVSDIDIMIEDIRKDKFPNKYVIIFTKKDKLYMIIFEDRLVPLKFKQDFFGVQETIIVKDYV